MQVYDLLPQNWNLVGDKRANDRSSATRFPFEEGIQMKRGGLFMIAVILVTGGGVLAPSTAKTADELSSPIFGVGADPDS
jgi:hypothetical protein